jgi:hypothetical protein
MARQYVEIIGCSAASRAIVYSVAKRSSGYPDWSMIGSFKLVRPGRNEEDGVGQLRIFRTGLLTLLEEVVELVPCRRVSYVLIKGLPFRDYRADIDLSPIKGGGTRIRWSSSFYPKIWGTGWLCRAFMAYIFSRIVSDLARAAENIDRPSTLQAPPGGVIDAADARKASKRGKLHDDPTGENRPDI